VNTITPGWINTRDAQMVHIDQFPEATNYRPWPQKCHEQHTVGRMGKGIDIAKMAWFLVTDDDGFITGQEFVVEGGMSTKMILYMDDE
jgi:NAD(P)-dependent dehydrogenase (short-subunit alcohol dehydrogenase family)